jgi:hypothetical protein
MTRSRQMTKTDKPEVAPPAAVETQPAAQPARPLTLEDRIKGKIAALDEKETKTQEEYDTYRQQVNAQMGYFQGALNGIKEQRDALRELLIPEGSDPDTSDDGPTENSDESPPPNPEGEPPQVTAVSSA